MADKSAKKTTTIKTGQPKIFYEKELINVYANHTGLLISDRDLTLDFGVRQPQMAKTSSEAPPVLINCRVMMSPQHAKLFAEKLNWVIQQYEKDFGEINTKPLT